MNKIAELYRKYEDDLRAYTLGQLPEAPNPPINRAYSYCVGWIGPWKEDELATAPGGRYLIPFNALDDPPATGLDQIYMKPLNVPASCYQENPRGCRWVL